MGKLRRKKLSLGEFHAVTPSVKVPASGFLPAKKSSTALIDSLEAQHFDAASSSFPINAATGDSVVTFLIGNTCAAAEITGYVSVALCHLS